MTKLFKYAFVAAVILLTSQAKLWAVDFSADFETITFQGVKHLGKLYVSGNRLRTDGEAGGANIQHLDSQTAYWMCTRHKVYGETKGVDIRSRLPALGQKIFGEKERKKLGSEIIDGHVTDKYEVTIQYHCLFHKQLVVKKYFIWMDPTIQIPRQTEGESRLVTKYSNIKIGPQPAALFEVPKDYEKVDHHTFGLSHKMLDK